MAELVVIGYATEAEAEEVMGVLRGLERDRVIATSGSAVATRGADTELRVASHTHASGADPASTALWGMIIGFLFFVPVAGTAFGGAMGALVGKMAEMGITQQFREQVAKLLTSGTAVVVILFQGATPERTIEALAPYGGTVLRSKLSNAAGLHLQEAFDARRSAAAPA